MSALFSSKYSIHDLSRCTGEGDERLARFNMPLELGMAMALRYLETMEERKHDWLVLVPRGYRHVRFVSDLTAFDLGAHDGTVATVVPKVMSWLATRDDQIRTPPLPRSSMPCPPLLPSWALWSKPGESGRVSLGGACWR
jgi:hypothetical protein